MQQSVSERGYNSTSLTLSEDRLNMERGGGHAKNVREKMY